MKTLKITVSPEMQAIIKAAYPKPRPLYQIAVDIRSDWPKPYFGAVPYLNAMRGLQSIDDAYGLDNARSIVRYFLANAATWKGDKARAIKTELKGML
jgi:hypothetical protein